VSSTRLRPSSIKSAAHRDCWFPMPLRKGPVLSCHIRLLFAIIARVSNSGISNGVVKGVDQMRTCPSQWYKSQQ